jgi:ubiquinone/menaquinone biosynthesis C-methylase UbiE
MEATRMGGVGDHLAEADRVLVLGRLEEAFAAAAAVGMAGRVIAVGAGRVLAAAEERGRRAGWDGLEFHEEGRALPAADGSIDAVVISGPPGPSRRRGALLCEIARVLRAGGRLLVADGSGATVDFSTAVPGRT